MILSACLKAVAREQIQSSVNSMGYCSSIYRQPHWFVRYYIYALNYYIQRLQNVTRVTSPFTFNNLSNSFSLHYLIASSLHSLLDEACFVVLFLHHVEATLPISFHRDETCQTKFVSLLFRHSEAFLIGKAPVIFSSTLKENG
jgi:hypothetical protein